jgi:hypothetical protein
MWEFLFDMDIEDIALVLLIKEENDRRRSHMADSELYEDEDKEEDD